MSLSSILSELGYSEEFITIIEGSLLEAGIGDGFCDSDDNVNRVYDSVSCFIDESSTPVSYNEFSD